MHEDNKLTWEETNQWLVAINEGFVLLHNLPKDKQQPFLLELLRKRCIFIHQRRIEINQERMK